MQARGNFLFGVSLVLGVGAAVGACKRNQDGASAPLEAPDTWDNIAIFDPALKMEQGWDQVKTRLKGEARNKPWSDSYWPYIERGLAGRWMTRTLRSNPYILTPNEQLEEFVEVAEAGDASRLAELSPAEKYDYIMSWASGVRPSAAALEGLRQATSSIKPPGVKAETPEDRARLGMAAARERVNNAIDAGQPSATVNALVIDYLNSFRQLEKEIQFAYANNAESSSADEVRELALIEQRRLAGAIGEPLTALASAVPLFVDGWRSWANFASVYETRKQWLWIGHCHGWAAASAREARPKHSVLVRRKGHEILFTEGDIRALLTKLYSDQPPKNADMIGIRCESQAQDTAVTDGTYRVLDGVYCNSQAAKNQRTCRAQAPLNGEVMSIESLRFDDLRDPRDSRKQQIVKLLHFRAGPQRTQHRWATLVSTGQGDDHFAMTFASESERRGDYEYNRIRYLAGEPAFQNYNSVISLTKGCRGVNPVAVHLALAELVGKRGESFVVDVDRFGEVWNHAVYRYEAKVVPLRISENVVFDELISIDKIPDPFASFRAKGTRFLVQLETELWYGYENGPLPVYQPDDDRSVSIRLHYTLELDANKKIIGGEWGHLTQHYPAKGAEGDAAALPEARAPAPDLLWRFKPTDTVFKAGLLDPAIVRRIHQCSQSEGATAKFDMAGQQVSYSTCDL